MKLLSTTRFQTRRFIAAWLIFTLFSHFVRSQATVSYFTEAVPAGNIQQNTAGVIYILKIVVGPGAPVQINGLSLKTSGTYTGADISKFTLLKGPDTDVANAVPVGINNRARGGGGETVSWQQGTDMSGVIGLAANSTSYFFVEATTDRQSTAGRTIGINGADNALTIIYYTPVSNPLEVDNQSDVAGLHTISAPSVTYSTATLPAADASKGPTEHLIYVLKVEGGSGTSSFNTFSIKTAGTYSGSDIKKFSVYGNTSVSLTGAAYLGDEDQVSGSGETLHFEIAQQSIGENTTRYYLITAEIQPGAVIGNTFGINGADNALSLGYVNNPVVTNNQTNAAGLRTITGPSVTYSTVPLAPGGMGPGLNNAIIYILKVETGSIPLVSYSSLSLKTGGTYTSADISGFSIWRNSTPGMQGARRAGSESSIEGNGETLSFSFNRDDLDAIPANATVYFLLTADVSASATTGRTVGVDGSGNALSFSFTGLTPSVTDHQTNVAGPKTIIDASVTYSTVALPAGEAFQNSADHLLYILKVETGPGAVTFDRLHIQTTGTYTSDDISQFKLWVNDIPRMDEPRYWDADESVEGHGETLSFSGSQTLAANTITYFLVTANVNVQAAGGHTFGINGAANALDVDYDTDPGIINNQDNTAGLQTIGAPQVVYATIPVGASDVLRGANQKVLYIFSISTGDGPGVFINNISIRTTGTYTASDIASFQLFRSKDARMTPETIEAQTGGSAVTGHGEVVSFAHSYTLESRTTTYFGIVANVAGDATPGRTFGIDGSDNNLTVSFPPTAHLPTIADNQTDVAGLQTIFAYSVTVSTEPLVAENVEQGSSNQLAYLLKFEVGESSVGFNTIQIKTTGTYTSSDISSFRLLRARDTPTAVEGSLSPVSATGHGEVLTFSTYQFLDANTTYYYRLTATVAPDATTGHTFGVDGSDRPLGVNFLTANTIINKIDNQTGVSGLRTIGVSPVVYTTEPLRAGKVVPGAADQPVYVLKVAVNGDAAATLINLSVATSGTYGPGDIDSFNLYQSDTPIQHEGGRNGRVSGTPIATVDAPAGAGETLSFNTGGFSLPAGKATYLIIHANVSESATLKRIFHINGEINPAVLFFSGIAPSPMTNSQTNSAGEQMIDGGLPVTLVSFKAQAEGSVRHLLWETSMEIDNDYFEIQRSTDARNFSAIGQIKGAAAGFETHRYRYTDSESMPFRGAVYYRLKMVDLDRSFAYSSIVSVGDESRQMPEAIVFPNPFSKYIQLKYVAGETVFLEWATADGRWVGDTEKHVIPSSGQFQVSSLDRLAPGIYFLTIRSAAGKITQKIVKH